VRAETWQVGAETWQVRAQTWQVRALTWRVRTLSAAPLQKAMSVSNYPPYPCALLSFCLALPCGIVASARPDLGSARRDLASARRDMASARPDMASARPHLACARPLRRASPKSNVGVQLPPLSVRIAVFLPSATMWDSSKCAPILGKCAPRLGKCTPSLGMCMPSPPPLSKKQCRCPTTPLIPAYCCLFAFRYHVG
jgi:hypothetical protein